MINFERFTNYAHEIIFAANAKKDFYKNTEVQPEHIMLVMLEYKGLAKDYLTELGLINQHFINEIVARIKLSQQSPLQVILNRCLFQRKQIRFWKKLRWKLKSLKMILLE